MAACQQQGKSEAERLATEIDIFTLRPSVTTDNVIKAENDLPVQTWLRRFETTRHVALSNTVPTQIDIINSAIYFSRSSY